MPLQILLLEQVRLQIAHLGQMLSLMLLLPIVFSMNFNKNDIKALLYFLIFMLFAVINAFSNIYGLFLGLLYVVSMLQVIIYIKYIFVNEKNYYLDVVKKLVYFSRFISFLIFIYFLDEPKFFYSFLMQDKTYFLVYIFTLVFAEIYLYKSQHKNITFFSYLYMVFLIGISITSASRSVAFFLPLCFYIFYDAMKNKLINKYIKLSISTILTCSFLYIFYTVTSLTQALGVDNPLFAFDRFLGALDSSDNVVSIHFLFLNISITEKFSSFYNFFFGVGLANFQFSTFESLLWGELAQHESHMRYAIFSPSFLYMPGVSIWGELFLELPIFLFLPIVFYAIKIFYDAFINKDYFSTFFMFGLFGSGFFYSIHHSSSFYLGLFLLLLVRYSYKNNSLG